RKNEELQDMTDKVASLEKEVEYLKDDNQDSEELYKKVFTSLQLE
ncbi:12907_t:CDS:1, partial [Gigaspora margarita]